MAKKKVVVRFASEAAEVASKIGECGESYKLHLGSVVDDAYGLSVVYKNDFAGVMFEFSPLESCGWRVVVGRLVDNCFPKHPGRLSHDTILDRFDIRDIAALRIDMIPELSSKIEYLAPLDLQEFCFILMRCCRDIFFGDFSLFPALQERVLGRVA
jgi:hypothetical protein